MAYETDTAANYLDLTDRIRKFVCGYGTHTLPAFSGTGSGLIGFTSYDRIDYSIGTRPTSITESWTITCTNAAVVGAEIWSVVGSVSGSQAAATTGVDYLSSFVDFTIEAGGSNFSVSDNFTFDVVEGLMTTEAQAWTQEIDQGYPAQIEDLEIVLKGPGLSGTDEIFVALRPYADTGSDYHNLLVRGMTGYTASPYQALNPSNYANMPLWDSNMVYWIVGNGRRFVVSVKVNTTYMSMYAGFILPYATPAQYPYPLLIAANSYTAVTKWTDGGHYLRSIADPGSVSTSSAANYATSMSLCLPSSIWHTFQNTHGATSTINIAPYRNVSPTANGGFADQNTTGTKIRNNLDDNSRDLFPLVLSSVNPYPSEACYGEMDGCYWTSGFGSVGSESTLNIGGDEYMMFQNVSRTTWRDYWAMRLD